VASKVLMFVLFIITPIRKVFGMPSSSDLISCLYRKDMFESTRQFQVNQSRKKKEIFHVSRARVQVEVRADCQ